MSISGSPKIEFSSDLWLDAPPSSKRERTDSSPPDTTPSNKRARTDSRALHDPVEGGHWLLCGELGKQIIEKVERKKSKAIAPSNFRCIWSSDPILGEKKVTLERLDNEKYLYIKKLVLVRQEGEPLWLGLDFDDYSKMSYILYKVFAYTNPPPFELNGQLKIEAIWKEIKRLKLFTPYQIESVERCLYPERFRRFLSHS